MLLFYPSISKKKKKLYDFSEAELHALRSLTENKDLAI